MTISAVNKPTLPSFSANLSKEAKNHLEVPPGFKLTEVPTSTDIAELLKKGSDLVAKLLILGADFDSLDAQSGITRETTTKTSGETIETTIKVTIDREKQNAHLRAIATGLKDSTSQLPDAIKLGSQTLTQSDARQAFDFIKQAVGLYSRRTFKEESSSSAITPVDIGEDTPKTEESPKVEEKRNSFDSFKPEGPEPFPPTPREESSNPTAPPELRTIANFAKGLLDPNTIESLRTLVGTLSEEQLGLLVKEILK